MTWMFIIVLGMPPMPHAMRPAFMGNAMMYGQRPPLPQNIIEKGPEIKKVADHEGRLVL